MKRFLSPLLLLLVCGSLCLSVSPANAQVTIEYSALGNNIRDTDGTTADAGELVRLGLFPSSFDFAANQTFSSLNSAFTQIDTTTIAGASGTSSGEFFDTATTLDPNFLNKQLYLWILNTSTASNPTAWVILTNPNWVTPAAGPDTEFLDTSDVGTFIPAGALGIAVAPIKPTAANGVDWQMTAVPEPSTYALIAFGLAGLAFARRKRSRSSKVS